MSQSSNNLNGQSAGAQQYAGGAYYYPQYAAYPYSYSYGAQSTQPINVDVNSKNKGGRSTGLTVLKAIALILFMALTIGVGVLAWKGYKKADKLMDKVDNTLDNTNKSVKELTNEVQHTNKTLSDIKTQTNIPNALKTIEEIFKEKEIFNRQDLLGLDTTKPTVEPSVGG